MRARKTLVAVTAATVATACSAGAVIAGGGGGAPDNSKEIERALDSRQAEERDPADRSTGPATASSTIGRYYLNGANGPPMAYETLPFTGEYRTWTPQVRAAVPTTRRTTCPDSAPTAVAWSTGKKTGDARLSQRDEHGPDRCRLERRVHDDVRDHEGARQGGRQRDDARSSATPRRRRRRRTSRVADARVRLTLATCAATETKAVGRARLDRRAAGRSPARRQPRRRPRAATRRRSTTAP